jgi:hypothetical protein
MCRSGACVVGFAARRARIPGRSERRAGQFALLMRGLTIALGGRGRYPVVQRRPAVQFRSSRCLHHDRRYRLPLGRGARLIFLPRGAGCRGQQLRDGTRPCPVQQDDRQTPGNKAITLKCLAPGRALVTVDIEKWCVARENHDG